MRFPVRMLERIDDLGDVTVARSVFCLARQCSTSIDTCRSCPHMQAVDDSLVECSSEIRENTECMSDGGLGDDVCVGQTMSDHSIVIRTDAPVSVAAEVLARAPGAVATGILVDRDNRIVGLVERADASTGGWLDVIRRPLHAVGPIRESATLATAIGRMVKGRCRVLPVVDDEGRVVGLISDLDALHWISRRGH